MPEGEPVIGMTSSATAEGFARRLRAAPDSLFAPNLLGRVVA
jgi:hypothetical protein